MILVVLFFLFVLGAVLASFAGVVAGRLYTGQGIVQGRSRCDLCGRELAAIDLVPVFSWLVSRGRSRCCGGRIQALAPLSELALGSAFVASYYLVGDTAALVPLLAALVTLAALVLYDLTHQILPPVLLAVFIPLAGCYRLLATPMGPVLLETAIFAAGIAAFFALLWALSGGRAMGLADAPLAFGLALIAGPASFVGFLLSFWIGAVVGIAMLALPALGATMKSEVPFAPFLATGFLLATFTQWDPFAITALVEALL